MQRSEKKLRYLPSAEFRRWASALIVMTITFELDSPQDLLLKARREKARLHQALVAQDRTQIADAIFNFAVTAYHVKDWLKESTSCSYTPDDVETYLHLSRVLRVCREICNASKHQKLKLAKDTVAVTTSATTVVSIGNLHTGGVSLETEQIPTFRVKVVTLDGSRFEVMDFSAQVIAAWEQFFTHHGLSI